MPIVHDSSSEWSSERNDRIGKYLTVFRKQADGSWKIFRDCFNLDVPA